MSQIKSRLHYFEGGVIVSCIAYKERKISITSSEFAGARQRLPAFFVAIASSRTVSSSLGGVRIPPHWPSEKLSKEIDTSVAGCCVGIF